MPRQHKTIRRMRDISTRRALQGHGQRLYDAIDNRDFDGPFARAARVMSSSRKISSASRRQWISDDLRRPLRRSHQGLQAGSAKTFPRPHLQGAKPVHPPVQRRAHVPFDDTARGTAAIDLRQIEAGLARHAASARRNGNSRGLTGRRPRPARTSVLGSMTPIC